MADITPQYWRENVVRISDAAVVCCVLGVSLFLLRAFNFSLNLHFALLDMGSIIARMLFFWKIVFALVVSGVLAAAAERNAVYDNNCVACHGGDGSGRTPQGRKIKVHDLRESKLTDAEIERQIREGAKNKSGVAVMPAFGRDLTDAEIKEAVATVKAFRVPPAGPAS